MNLVSIDAIDEMADVVPVVPIPEVAAFNPPTGLGASRYACDVLPGMPLEALLLNAGTDTLVVSFHGALNRSTYALPRFERLKMLRASGHSSLFFADPSLHLDAKLQLAWFAGTADLDLFPLLADWINAAARAVGARHIILSGSSGGGFAALQVSAILPGTIGLVFNPQTAISTYLEGGTSYGSQRYFVDNVMPSLAPDGFAAIDPAVDWSEPLGDRLSSLRRYATPRENYVLYAENRDDFHYEQHYLPFLAAAARGDNLGRIRVHEYAGGVGHAPPSPTVFVEALDLAVAWSKRLAATNHQLGD